MIRISAYGPGPGTLSPGPGRDTGAVGRGSRWAAADSGMVLLEFALVIPLLFLVCIFAAWMLRTGQVQAQLDDATRSGARELARGRTVVQARGAAEEVLAGARLEATRNGGTISVTGRYHLEAPVPALRSLGVNLSSSLVVRPEPGL